MDEWVSFDSWVLSVNYDGSYSSMGLPHKGASCLMCSLNVNPRSLLHRNGECGRGCREEVFMFIVRWSLIKSLHSCSCGQTTGKTIVLWVRYETQKSSSLIISHHHFLHHLHLYCYQCLESSLSVHVNFLHHRCHSMNLFFAYIRHCGW